VGGVKRAVADLRADVRACTRHREKCSRVLSASLAAVSRVAAMPPPHAHPLPPLSQSSHSLLCPSVGRATFS